MNVADLLSEAAAAVPAKTALVVAAEGSRSSYRELDREADAVAAGLQRLGVGAGDRVAFALGNVPRFASAYFGILRAGAIAVPLNVLLTASEMGVIVDDADPAVVLAGAELGDLVVGATKTLPSPPRVITTAEWDDLARSGTQPEPVEVEPDDLAVLAYTSGTTGAPKGAMLSHANLLANLDQQMAVPYDQITRDDVLFLALPLFHIFGLNVTLGLTIMNAATGILMERFDPVPALRAIEENRVTVIFGAPTMYGAWVSVPGADQYDLSRARLAVSGAAPLPSEVLRDFHDLFGVEIYEGYGLSETAPTLTSARMGPRVKPGSVGKPLPGVEIRLVDENAADVEQGDPGEVIVRGPNVFQGYWHKPDETNAAFLDGWFRTGDVAIQDDDGYIQLVDRKRDLIIVSGFNVFPSEVEAALLQNPVVREAAVVGVPHAYTGEAVKAFVVLEPGAETTSDDICALLRTRLARFKLPDHVEIVPELPHALTGKVLRRALRT